MTLDHVDTLDFSLSSTYRIIVVESYTGRTTTIPTKLRHHTVSPIGALAFSYPYKLYNTDNTVQA